MKNIVIGQYIPGKGLFYRMDPRTKIISVITLMIAIFLLGSIPQLLVAFSVCAVMMWVGNIPVKRVIRGMKPLIILLLFTFFFQIFFNKEGKLLLDEVMHVTVVSVLGIVLWTILWRLLARIGKFKTVLLLAYIMGIFVLFRFLPFGYSFTTFRFAIYEKGIEMSIFVIIRLVIIISLSTVLTLTTKPTDLTQGLESLMRPLKIIGIRSEDFALIISISLRYIPTILDEAFKIMAAQASRGADFAEGKLKDKVKQVISLLVPMFIIAFKRSEDLADAMESRNFVPGKPRTRIHELRFGWTDIGVGIFTLAALALTIVLKVIG